MWTEDCSTLEFRFAGDFIMIFDSKRRCIQPVLPVYVRACTLQKFFLVLLSSTLLHWSFASRMKGIQFDKRTHYQHSRTVFHQFCTLFRSMGSF